MCQWHCSLIFQAAGFSFDSKNFRENLRSDLLHQLAEWKGLTARTFGVLTMRCHQTLVGRGFAVVRFLTFL